jgi:hypothetical protein
VALGRVALEAEQGHTAGQRARELIEQRLLGGEIPAEIGEVALEIAVGAKAAAQVARYSERALVPILDVDSRERFRRGVLEKPLRRESGSCRTSSRSVTPADFKVARNAGRLAPS